MPETLLTVDQVAEYLALGRSTVYAHVAAGDLPAPIRIGVNKGSGADRRSSRWRESDLSEYVRRKAEEAQAPQPEASA